jgi:alpha-L-rhamnosidase
MNGESQKILSGNFEAWCYQTLAGINYDPERPGFKHIILRPRVVGDLTFVSAAHRCPYGEIESRWQRTADSFTWRFTVPPNTTATVYVPAAEAASVTENGQPAAKSPHIALLRTDRGCAVYQVPSGRYEFRSAL